jgi:hypothetical protein
MLMLSLTLATAPCAHCTIQPAAQAAEPGHDCCPKQKQGDEVSDCGWMPAQYVTPEGITPGVELAAVASTAAHLAFTAPSVPTEAPRFDAAPPPASPPLYLAQSALLI